LLTGRRAGLNLLVTPANLGLLDVLVTDAIHQGARNVLLLGYKGADATLHLSTAQLDQLRQSVLRLQHLPLRLDICWYPLLSDLPHLFARGDCGAGDEFLVITPDQAVQPCSFHHERIPFETFDELRRIYDELRQRRPAASVGGCTRRQFVPLAPTRTASRGVWFWQARASNNSGDWTIVGRFRSVELAQQAAEALRRLSRAHEAFLASPEGQAWIEDHDYYGLWPTPPIQEFGKAHGFEWSGDGEGLWWEEDGCGAPVLTAGAVGDAVVVYHPYCMGLPEGPFREFFAAVGATEFGYWQYGQPSVIAMASGENADAQKALQRYLASVEAAEYPSDAEEPPPWGNECEDARVLDDEDRSAILTSGPCALQVEAGQLRLVLTFQNTFAGALAVERWLKEQGYSNVTVRVDHLPEPLHERRGEVVRPNNELFSEVRPLSARLAEMSNAQLLETLFGYHSEAPTILEETVGKIPVAERLRLAEDVWRKRRTQRVDVDWRALLVIEQAGPAAADWLRELWPLLVESGFRGMGMAFRAMASALPPGEGFGLAQQWLAAAHDQSQYTERLKYFVSLRNPGTIPLIEDWWASAEPSIPVTEDWGVLAAKSHIDWLTLRRWLKRGRPFALIALTVLEYYAANGPPPEFVKPEATEFTSILESYKTKDRAPRAATAVARIVAAADKLTAAQT
jgi:hypothetical protein